MKKQKKKLTDKQKLTRLKILKFLFLLGPISIIVAINYKEYVPVQTQATEGWKLPIGLIIFAIIVAVLVINPSKKKIEASEMADLKVLAIVFVLAVVLDPIISDLKLLSGCALGGSIINYMFINHKIIKIQKRIEQSEVADINAEAIVRAQEKARER